MKTLLAGAAALALVAAPAAFAQQAAAPAASAVKLSSASGIKALVDNPKALEVLQKHIPQVAEFFASGQADGVLPPTTTLKEISEIPQAQDAGLTGDALKKIDEDLAKL
jgi:hypothetical protein